MRFDYKDFFRRLKDKISDDDILGNAAQVAFYFSFALFPLLLFLMSLLGIILSDKTELQAELFTILGQVMPASAFELVRTTMEEVTAHASGGKLTLGLLITLWSASAGIDNMRGTLNGVYNLKETRSWFKAKLTTFLLTLGVGVLILIALGVAVYGGHLLGSAGIDSAYIKEPLQWLAVLCVVILIFAVIYNFAPNHDPFEWKWITPGSVGGVILWVLLSGIFRIYLHYFDSYAATYGSLGAVIILMLWLYLTAFVILLGGAANAILDEKSGIKKEAKDPKQVKEERTGTGNAAQAA